MMADGPAAVATSAGATVPQLVRMVVPAVRVYPLVDTPVVHRTDSRMTLRIRPMASTMSVKRGIWERVKTPAPLMPQSDVVASCGGCLAS